LSTAQRLPLFSFDPSQHFSQELIAMITATSLLSQFSLATVDFAPATPITGDTVRELRPEEVIAVGGGEALSSWG